MEGEETLGGEKVVRLELTPKSEDVRKQDFQDRTLAGRSELAARAAEVLRNRNRRLLHHSLYECRSERRLARLALQAALACRSYASQASGLDLSFLVFPARSPPDGIQLVQHSCTQALRLQGSGPTR